VNFTRRLRDVVDDYMAIWDEFYKSFANCVKHFASMALSYVQIFVCTAQICQPYYLFMYNSLLSRPKTIERFAALMELYEKNYVLMRLLSPELKDLESGVYVSQVQSSLPLELTVLSHSRYTSTFNLTYRFFESSNKGRSDREPDLAIRLYHDARACEVMSGLMPEGRVEVRRTRDLDEGRRLNRFLSKWLNYCFRQGHQFPCVPSSPTQLDAVYCTQY
jgi:uncharacterized protein YqiB (DUF1249 family)